MKGSPKPSGIYILGNCPAHMKHEVELRALVGGKCGAKLIFLAPYSPVDSPTEMKHQQAARAEGG